MEERNWERDSGENPMLACLKGFESVFGVLSERWEIKIRIGTIYTQTNQDCAIQIIVDIESGILHENNYNKKKKTVY